LRPPRKDDCNARTIEPFTSSQRFRVFLRIAVRKSPQAAGMIPGMFPPLAADLTPPVERSPLWGRVGGIVVIALIFWADAITPMGIAVPVLYVAPVLLFMLGGRFWEPLVVAAGASALIVAGIYIKPSQPLPNPGLVNRVLEAVVVWISAGIVSRYRWTLMRWAAQHEADRSARERSLQRLEEIRYALDQAAIVAMTDQHGIITYVNDKFCEISQYSREELVGQTHRIINSRYHSKDFFRALWSTIAGGQVWRGEIRNRAKDGSFYWVDTTIVPFLDAAGKPRQYLAIRSDITQRKRAEAKLVEQSALAQLGQLAAVVAHEVRNPLAGVRGTLQVLRSRAASEGDRSVMDAMISRLDVLNNKVEDILRFARPRPPVLERIDLLPVLIDAANSALAAAGPSCPRVDVPSSAPAVVGDREMLRDVLLNLLLNACQSGSSEAIEVSIADHGGTTTIGIADRGAGFGSQDPEQLFQAFHTTKKSGTGLGLAIVRRLMSLQNGEVTLQAREGGGAVARITLPTSTA
jgi:PAS domain S-box-containing protein